MARDEEGDYCQKLPTAKNIVRLTLRGLAAYGTFRARQCTIVLGGRIDASVIEPPLGLLESIATAPNIVFLDFSSAISAASRAARSMSSSESAEFNLSLLCITATSRLILGILTAAGILQNAEGAATRGYGRAVRAASQIAWLSVEVAKSDQEALISVERAWSEFNRLIGLSGSSEGRPKVFLGEPIDMSHEWWHYPPGPS